MANEYPLVSVIIPVHPAKTEARSAAASRQLDYPREKLADYKVPRQVIISPALPRNATGKILKTELRKHLGAQ